MSKILLVLRNTTTRRSSIISLEDVQAHPTPIQIEAVPPGKDEHVLAGRHILIDGEEYMIENELVTNPEPETRACACCGQKYDEYEMPKEQTMCNECSGLDEGLNEAQAVFVTLDKQETGPLGDIYDAATAFETAVVHNQEVWSKRDLHDLLMSYRGLINVLARAQGKEGWKETV